MKSKYPFPPMDDDEIYELVTSCLVGRLPVATEKRLISTAGELMRIRKLLSDPMLVETIMGELPLMRSQADDIVRFFRKHLESL